MHEILSDDKVGKFHSKKAYYRKGIYCMGKKFDDVYYRVIKMGYKLGVKSGLIKRRPLIDDENSIQHTFYGTKVLAAQNGNDVCKELLQNDSPCMIGRVGTVEMGIIQAYIDKEAKVLKHISKQKVNLLCNNAGFFPNEENEICKFAKLYIECAREVDVFGVFGSHAEDFFLNKYAPMARLMQFTSLEPFYFRNPWSYALKGKRVLVIHPFEESIKKQYERREVLFDNPQVLPEFELITIKAVQTIGDSTAGFRNWFEALEYMKTEIDKVNFDIALIGCGAYAFPLAAYIKQKGKKSVITAGATQLLFGIKGARWDHAQTPVPYKDTWIRPCESEKPKQASTVEGGCYW